MEDYGWQRKFPERNRDWKLEEAWHVCYGHNSLWHYLQRQDLNGVNENWRNNKSDETTITQGLQIRRLGWGRVDVETGRPKPECKTNDGRHPQCMASSMEGLAYRVRRRILITLVIVNLWSISHQLITFNKFRLGPNPNTFQVKDAAK